MDNLQDLFDAYLKTKPSAEKIRSATSMMIHLSKALNVANQEEINSDYFSEVVSVLDEFFQNAPQKAILDKAILAEMIGRIGPKPGIRIILHHLLSDSDENVRQYTLQSLEYYGKKFPRSVLKYIEKYRKSDDVVMLTAAASLTAKLFHSSQYQYVLSQIKIWCAESEPDFLEEVLSRIQKSYAYTAGNNQMSLQDFKSWITSNCKNYSRFVKS